MSDGMKKIKVPLQFDGTITDRDGVTIARMNRDSNSTYLTPSERDDVAKELVDAFNAASDGVMLPFEGYVIEGEAMLNLWGGGQGTVDMKCWFIPKDKWCRATLLEGINDGGFGCQSIEWADVWIYKTYGEFSPHKVLTKQFRITGRHLLPVKRGIQISE